MSNARIIVSSKTSDRRRTPITRSSDVDLICEGSGPCVTRMATPEEMAIYDAIPIPPKRKSRVMKYSF